MKIFLGIIGAVVFILFLWSAFWLAKTGSYNFFYKGMVQGTVREIVKDDSLK